MERVSTFNWIELWRKAEKAKAEASRSELSVSNGNLRPFLDAKNARNRRYSLLRELSRLVWRCTLPMHAVRYCSRRAIPAKTKNGRGDFVPTGKSGNIEIHSREVEGGAKKHNYHGLGRCASPLVCPFCSAIIQSFRAQETMLMGQYMLQNGFQVALITQTASHTRATSLVDFVARFQAAQRDLKEHKAYKTWKKETGAKFTIRAVETTDDNPDVGGRKTGWHFHSHTIVFFERPKAFTKREAEKFTRRFKEMWVKALEGVGLEGSIERAARVDLPRANEKLDAARETQSVEDVQKLCAYISKAFGWEVAGSRNKKGRSEKDRRISVWELQEAALTNRPDLLPRYAEYMRAVKGLHWLQFSQGLKAFCGLPEIKDKEVLEGGEKGEFVYWFSNENFKHIWRQAGQGKLLDIADREGRDGIEKAMFAAMNNCDIETGEQLE